MISWLNKQAKNSPYKLAIFGTLVPFWIWCGFIEVLPHLPHVEGMTPIQLFFAIGRTAYYSFDILVEAPVVEELVFRGLLWWFFSKIFRFNGGGVATLFVTSIMFALIHSDLAHIMRVMPLSFFLGYLRLKTGSVRPCIVAHMTWNLSCLVNAMAF